MVPSTIIIPSNKFQKKFQPLVGNLNGSYKMFSKKVRNCHTFLTEIKDLIAFSFIKGFPMNLLDFVTYKTPKIIDNNHI